MWQWEVKWCSNFLWSNGWKIRTATLCDLSTFSLGERFNIPWSSFCMMFSNYWQKIKQNKKPTNQPTKCLLKTWKSTFKKWQVCVPSHITYFHKGALVYSKEPYTMSSFHQTRGLGSLKIAFFPQQSLFPKMPVKLNNKFKISLGGAGNNALFSELWRS